MALRTMPTKQAEAGAPDTVSSVPSRTRMKASDLPLSSAVRNAIDGIVHTLKKQGNYDEIRKQVSQSFTDDVSVIVYIDIISKRLNTCRAYKMGLKNPLSMLSKRSSRKTKTYFQRMNPRQSYCSKEQLHELRSTPMPKKAFVKFSMAHFAER